MRGLLKVVSLIGLILTLAPSLLVFTGTLELSDHKVLTLVGTVLWFSTAPFWMNSQHSKQPA